MPSPSYELAHCVVCGHADADVVADADDMRADYVGAFLAAARDEEFQVEGLDVAVIPRS